MTGVAVELEGLQETIREAEAMSRRMRDMTPAYQAGAAAVLEHVAENFSKERGPDGKSWTPLNAEYAARRKPGKILQQDRVLANSVNASGGPDGIRFGANTPYAAAQHFGHKATPARPYLPTLDGETFAAEPGTPGGELADEILDTIADYVADGDG